MESLRLLRKFYLVWRSRNMEQAEAGCGFSLLQVIAMWIITPWQILGRDALYFFIISASETSWWSAERIWLVSFVFLQVSDVQWKEDVCFRFFGRIKYMASCHPDRKEKLEAKDSWEHQGCMSESYSDSFVRKECSEWEEYRRKQQEAKREVRKLKKEGLETQSQFVYMMSCQHSHDIFCKFQPYKRWPNTSFL